MVVAPQLRRTQGRLFDNGAAICTCGRRVRGGRIGPCAPKREAVRGARERSGRRHEARRPIRGRVSRAMLLRSAAALLALSIGATSWGTARPSPAPREEPFTTSEQCAVCHTPAPGANAMHSRLGDDVSPYGTWQGTMMAN